MSDGTESAIIEKLLERTRAAQAAFVSGDGRPYADQFHHGEDATFHGPFGGLPMKGWTEIGPRMAGAAGLFEPGAERGSIDLVAGHVSGDLAVLVTVERNRVRFKGTQEIVPWDLRVTLAFRRMGDEWRMVHRHADPLVPRLSLDAAKALTNGSKT